MRATFLMGTAFAVVPAIAQAQDYKVWSSFVYLQGGEYTPAALPNTSVSLTSIGALQMYEAGQFLRSEYLDGLTKIAKIASLISDQPSPEQVDIVTLDMQYTSASAQALLVGMYPQSSIGAGGSDIASLDSTSLNATSADSMTMANTPLTSTDIFANGSVIQSPLLGVTFPLIRTAGWQDAKTLFIAGDANCPAFDQFAASAVRQRSLMAIEQASQVDYSSINAILNPVFPPTSQHLSNAKMILDYVTYQKLYNRTAMELLSQESTIMDNLSYYADVQQASIFANLTAGNPPGGQAATRRVGSISTIAGASLAASIASTFAAQQGREQASTRLQIIVGAHAPMLGIFALLGLPSHDAAFSKQPLPGSAMVFELVTPAGLAVNGMAHKLPPSDQLMVRFRFRNGTGISAATPAPGGGGDLITWPISNNKEVLSYADFMTAMGKISIAGPGDWCNQCGSAAMFCAPWNASLTLTKNNTNAIHPGVSLVQAGAIGAVVGIAAIALLMAIILMISGVRFHRTQPLWITSRRRLEVRNSRSRRALSPVESALMTKVGTYNITHNKRGAAVAAASVAAPVSMPATPNQKGSIVNFFDPDASAAPQSSRLGSWYLSAGWPFNPRASLHRRGVSEMAPSTFRSSTNKADSWSLGSGARLTADDLNNLTPGGWPLSRQFFSGTRMSFGRSADGTSTRGSVRAEEDRATRASRHESTVFDRRGADEEHISINDKGSEARGREWDQGSSMSEASEGTVFSFEVLREKSVHR